MKEKLTYRVLFTGCKSLHYYGNKSFIGRKYERIHSFSDFFEFKVKYTTGYLVRTQQVSRYSQIGNDITLLFKEQIGLILNNILS